MTVNDKPLKSAESVLEFAFPKKNNVKRVTIESGTDAPLHSADYAGPLKIYVNDECVYYSDGKLCDILPPRYETPAMKKMLMEHIATLHITSENIAAVRADLLMPFRCDWNGWVRDLTAERENKQ